MLSNMLAGDFCLWLKSVLDTRGAGPLTPGETTLIRENLSNVFRHEIDPLMGDDAHQALLNKIHSEPSQ
jgi:hypothetical protein